MPGASRALQHLIVCWLALGLHICRAQNSAEPEPCSLRDLRTSMTPPFPSGAAAHRAEIVLIFRNASERSCRIQGIPEVKFFLSSAAAGAVETSGPVSLQAWIDYFHPGVAEDERRAAPIDLEPGQWAHSLLAFDQSGNCFQADGATVAVNYQRDSVRVLHPWIHTCGSVYVSEYRRGDFSPSERIAPEWLRGQPADPPGPAVTGPLVPAAPLDDRQDIGVRDCKAADLDTRVAMPDRTASPVSIAFYSRNIGALPCSLRQPPGLGFADYYQGRSVDVKVCTNCTVEGESDWRKRIPEIILRPGNVARALLRLKIGEPNPASCREVDGIDWFVPGDNTHAVMVNLGTPMLSIYSPVEITPFALSADAGPDDAADDIHLTLAPEMDTVYEGGRVRLRLEFEDAASPLVSLSGPCPTIFSRLRNQDGLTRFDYIHYNPGECESRPSASPRPARVLDLGRFAQPSLGDSTLDLTQEFAKPGGELIRARSNTITLHVLDPKKVQRTWGPPVNGLAADLTLDRSTYSLGQDVPLHIAILNQASAIDIYRSPACENLAVSLRDAAGRLIGSKQVPEFCAWSGSDAPRRYERGEPRTFESSLLSEDLLPDQVGIYTLSVAWRPLSGVAVVSNQATFTIVAPDR